MTRLIALLAVALLAACSKVDGISSAQAESAAITTTTTTALYADVAEGAGDGQVYEYH